MTTLVRLLICVLLTILFIISSNAQSSTQADETNSIQSKIIEYITPALYSIVDNGSGFRVYKEENIVFIDSSGKETTIPNQHLLDSDIRQINNDRYIVQYKNTRKYVLINSCGRLLSKEYDLLSGFMDNRCEAISQNKSGFIDSNGKQVVPLIYDYADYFKKKRTVVRSKGKWGAIDDDGKIIIDINCDFLYESEDGTFIGKSVDGKPTRYDHDGKILTKELFVAWIEKRVGLYRGQKEIIPVIYDDVTEIGDNRFEVRMNNKEALFDSTGKVIVAFGFFEITGHFSYGLAPIKDKNRQYGFIDTAGTVVIRPQFQYAQPHNSSGLSIVTKDDKQGIIDINGKLIVGFFYDYIDSFTREEIIRVKQGDLLGYINNKGEKITELIFSSASEFKDGFATVSLNGRYGLINSKGKQITPLKYDFISDRNNGLIVVIENDKFGLIDNQGHEIIPCKFERLKGTQPNLGYPSDYYWYQMNGLHGLLRLIRRD